MRKIFAMTIAMLVFISVPVSAAIQSRLIDYKVEFHFGWPLSGKISERTRNIGNDNWQVERNALVFGFTAREVSKFRVSGDNVQNLWYYKEEPGLVKKGTITEITFTNDDVGVFDPISLAVKIGTDLRNEPNLTRRSYKISTRQGKVETFSFVFVHNQTVSTLLGPMKSVRVDQESEGDSYRSYWLSEQYDYIIIRAIEKDEDGKLKTEINIKNGSIGGKPIRAQ